MNTNIDKQEEFFRAMCLWEDDLALKLLDEGSDFFQQDACGMSPIAWLLDKFRCNELDVWDSPYLPRLAAPDVRDKNGNHALHYAIVAGNLEVVRKLLNLGTPADLETEDGISPRELALSMEWKHLTAYLTPLNRRRARKLPRPSLALRKACETADLPAIKASLEAGANPDGDEWDIPLYWTDDYEGPLYKLVQAKVPDEVAAKAAQWLLISGANPNRGDLYDLTTPLTEAVACGNLPMAKVLLDWGALPNEIDIRNGTALIYAVCLEAPADLELVELLLAAGADPNISADYGGTALDWALKYESHAVIDLLRAHGAKTAAELKNES